MQSYQVAAAIALLLALGGLSLFFFLRVAQLFMTKPVSIQPLFNGLRKKLWMTAGLGLFFFGLYTFIVLCSARLLNDNAKLALFDSARNHPTYFIYLGLLIFSTISLTILFIRKMIKNICNSRKIR